MLKLLALLGKLSLYGMLTLLAITTFGYIGYRLLREGVHGFTTDTWALTICGLASLACLVGLSFLPGWLEMDSYATAGLLWRGRPHGFLRPADRSPY